ncbi:UNVERIFIED_CONTAM: hypothetical protein Slati_1642100 [Sesamum latifolium]|uniref:Uncharacterized protein n=1 Tax=Sesamum latifolium TaxID=2727402 RepID=A0AAW2XDL0_9LAMI
MKSGSQARPEIVKTHITYEPLQRTSANTCNNSNIKSMVQTESTKMLKKMMGMLASKYLSMKAKMRAIETRLIMHSLLLRDNKVVRHLINQRRCSNLPNTVEVEDYQSDTLTAHFNNSIALAPAGIVQLADDKMGTEEDDEHLQKHCNLPMTVEVEDYKSHNYATPTYTSNATNPVSIVQLAEENHENPNLRHSFIEDNQMKDHSISVIEIVKNAKEGQGKEFKLEDDIDQVADLFIQRFHHHIRLQKSQSEPAFS